MKYDGFPTTLQFFTLPIALSILLFFSKCQSVETGPGGPILVVSDVVKNPFSRYTVEILKAEGLNEFEAAEIEDLSTFMLRKYDIILLGDIPLSKQQAAMFMNWVKAGGMLVGFKPDSLLQDLFGIRHLGLPPLADKYLQIKNNGPGAGIVGETIQYHSEADIYSLTKASTLATLFSDANTATPYPAVTSNRVGAGTAVAFTYDLCRSIVYTRQGNPMWQGQKRDGAINPIRSDDLFYPDWIDFNKIAIPQADEQQRFLSNIILKENRKENKPLPKFWYLPKGLKATIVMTGDDHGGFGTPARFDKYLEQGSNTAKDIADWNAVRATSYIYPGNPMTRDQVMNYEKQGFEIALHLSTTCDNWIPKQLDDEWVSQLGEFEEEFPGLPLPVTNRTHCMVWSDWASQPKIQAQYGIKLDVNYYYWPGAWVKNRPGFFTGSGMPMPFADIDGTIINCYQAPTQMTDESDINYTIFANQLMNNAIGDEGYYGVFVANMHTDHRKHAGSDIIVEAALKRKIPVVSAKQMLTWLEGRNNSSFGSITWDGDQLSFFILAAFGSNNMKAMLPISSKTKTLVSIAKDGETIPFTTELIKGINYAFFDAETGNYSAVYKEDNSLPSITNISAVPDPDGTATIKWITDEVADSRIDYGISGTSLTMVERDALPKTNHSVRLSGLFPGNTYHFRISSADEAGNVSIATSFDIPPLNFTMPGPVLINDKKFSDKNLNGTQNNIHLSDANGGEITLRPVFHKHFTGNGLSADMNADMQEKGSSISVTNGSIKIDGAVVSTRKLFAPGSTLEFEAVFDKEKNQAIGFATTNQKQDTVSVVIGTNDSLNGIYAKVGKLPEVLLLYSSEYSQLHHYRIEWKATRFVFFADGIESATIETVITDSMHVIMKDAVAGKMTLNTHWLQVSPYTSTTATYTSKVYDGGIMKKWDMVSWLAETPPGTAVKIFCRNGNTPVPDKSWTVFTAVEKNKNITGITSRYIQYKVELYTNDLNISPVFKSITISCSNAE